MPAARRWKGKPAYRRWWARAVGNAGELSARGTRPDEQQRADRDRDEERTAHEASGSTLRATGKLVGCCTFGAADGQRVTFVATLVGASDHSPPALHRVREALRAQLEVPVRRDDLGDVLRATRDRAGGSHQVSRSPHRSIALARVTSIWRRDGSATWMLAGFGPSAASTLRNSPRSVASVA